MRNNKGQFTKGQTPWNKGSKNFNPSPETQFKSGENHVGENHPSWKGGVQVVSNDCAYLWVGNKVRVRRPRKIYEENFGPIPTNYVIIHKDGNRYNDSPENLEAISRAENLRRNNEKNKHR
jgi:hypothetical protein